MIGIYGIHNIVNDKWYVWQSVNIEKRWESERLNLRKGSLHQNGCGIHIGNAYKKYGEKSFEWVILEECEKEKLNEREVFWISKKIVCKMDIIQRPVETIGSVELCQKKHEEK